jgi:hypothetical protein
MTHRNAVRKTLVVLLVLVAGTLAAAQSSWAWEWVFAHGTNGEIEDDAGCFFVREMGWGLEFFVRDSTWVHYPIPYKTQSSTASGTKQWKVRQVRLRFNTGDSHRVTNVHIYDGPVRLKAFDKTWATGWSGDQDLLIDLGAAYNVTRGLSVCFRVERGGNTGVYFVTVYGVGARFQ